MTEHIEKAPAFSTHAESSNSFAAQQQLLRTYIPELDGIRALAIISVVWHNVTAGHYTGGFIPRTINLFANMGWVGVQLFFVLSGFLITGILLDEKKSPYQLRNFYMRRFLRIFPLYYAVLAFALILLPLLNAAPAWLDADRQQQIWYWTFLINWSAPIFGDGIAFGHFWSLAVEEQFYLLWPLCVITLQRKTLVRICLSLIVIAFLVRAALIVYDLEFAMGAAYKFTIARWDALAVGALLALLLRDERWYKQVEKASPVIALITSIYILIFTAIDRNFAPVDPGAGAFNQTAVAFLFGVLLFAAVRADTNHATRWQRFLSLAPLRSVGKYSYAIYIFHLPMVQIAIPLWRDYFSHQPSLIGATAFALSVFAASYAAAYLSWIGLEQPCLRMKRFFSTSKKAALR